MELILFPNILGKGVAPDLWFPPLFGPEVVRLDGLIAESDRDGRRFLTSFETKKPAQQIPITIMPEKPSRSDLAFLLEPILAGEVWGLVSDGGLPCLADPGADVVAYARNKKVKITALPGPSAMTQALMLSGFRGQRFAFHGYLSRSREGDLKRLEKRGREDRATQLFMEAPYRNLETLKAALEVLQPETELCVAWELTQPDEGVITKTIREWRKLEIPDIHKKPAVFLIAGTSEQAPRPQYTGRRGGRFPR